MGASAASISRTTYYQVFVPWHPPGFEQVLVEGVYEPVSFQNFTVFVPSICTFNPTIVFVVLTVAAWHR